VGRLNHYPPKILTLPPSYRLAKSPQPAPRIALVTPSYQQGAFIERTIQSILDQSYPEIEYVVQDGGSTDTTIAILKHYGSELLRWDSRPRFWSHKFRHHGLAQFGRLIAAWRIGQHCGSLRQPS
jgi:cellulose synthase/poly-beta-1,6-N-acetylglucosamine synthase-like glycosyltransferase